MGVTTSVYVKESRVCVKERYQFIEEHYYFLCGNDVVFSCKRYCSRQYAFA